MILIVCTIIALILILGLLLKTRSFIDKKLEAIKRKEEEEEVVPPDAIDISDLDKAAVLAALYNGARPYRSSFLAFEEGSMTVEEAQAILDEGETWFTYVKGRALYVNMSKRFIRTQLYDEYNGPGSAMAIIGELRFKGTPDGPITLTIHEHGLEKAHAGIDAY